VATLWDVADDPTSLIVSRFYQALAGGADKAQALRTAQLHVLRALRRGEVKVTTPLGVVSLPENPLLPEAIETPNLNRLVGGPAADVSVKTRRLGSQSAARIGRTAAPLRIALASGCPLPCSMLAADRSHPTTGYGCPGMFRNRFDWRVPLGQPHS
jgi:CHAT domain-containing protein